MCLTIVVFYDIFTHPWTPHATICLGNELKLPPLATLLAMKRPNLRPYCHLA